MQSLGKFLFCAGLGILLNCDLALAQDAPKPIAIQVVIGADGSVKVIDARTGKALDDAAIKLLAKPGAVEIQKLDKKKVEDVQKEIDRLLELEFKGKTDPKAKSKPFELEFDLRLEPLPDPEQFEKARKDLEKVRKDLEKLLQKKVKNEDEANQQLERALEAVERAKLKLKQRQAALNPPPADSVDKKLDLILKQLEDLRKDVDGIKKKLDGKKPDVIQWQVVPGSKPRPDGTIELEIVPVPGKDKKPDAPKAVPARPIDPNPRKIDDEVRKRLDDLIKQLEAEQRKNPPPPPPGPTQAELERELRRVLEAIEEAQRRERDKK